MEDPDMAAYATAQPVPMTMADVLGQNLQALTQILDSQQQMFDRQQEWFRRSQVSFKMLKMTKDDDPETYIEAFEHHALMTGLPQVYWASQLGALVVAVREEVSSMLRLGVVRPSRSPWRNLLVPIRKSDGSLRLCIDYRIGEAQYISTLDLAKGYWQIPVAPADRPKKAFGMPWGLYEFVRMPFGLHGVAATFQRLMDRLLAPHAGYAAAYIDDIIIYSPT
ncbi:hypothetical protein Y1Q_0015088 [Alligator mississippiensis]|uniref:ribonuclease H n=1 Tax=Alligator mississippiensis TaxID=8496 RepID=A0A151P8J4_ALLMI|nr:hypothetical protein Y1Q_0015088 [Alligator mississippiensis]